MSPEIQYFDSIYQNNIKNKAYNQTNKTHSGLFLVLPQRDGPLRTSLQRVHNTHRTATARSRQYSPNNNRRNRPHGSNHPQELLLYPSAAQAKRLRARHGPSLAFPGRAPQEAQLLEAGQRDPRRLLLLAPLQPLSERGGQGGARA